MQMQALNDVLEHLRLTFDFDLNETAKLLRMLHKTLLESAPILQSDNGDSIYHMAHKLHSELHMCGYESLSELAASIEVHAKNGTIDRPQIADFLSRSASFADMVEKWLTQNN
jgi:HPt (histidine-containing phosphotransfer) domain-containing protein